MFMDPDLSGAGSTLLSSRCQAPAVRFANMSLVSDDKTKSQTMSHCSVDQIWWKAQAVIFNSMALLLALIWSIQLVGEK